MSEIGTVDRKEIKKHGFPLPVYLSEEMFVSLPRNEKGTLLLLLRSTIEHQGLRQRLFEKPPYANSTIFLDNEGSSVCDGEELWRERRAILNTTINHVREKIRKCLNQALDLGLGNLKRIQELCAKYDVEP